MGIKENIKAIQNELPQGVILVAAAKTRSPEEIMEAAESGIKVIGENYAQEALAKFKVLGNKVKYHFIGHLQKNKVRKIVSFIDMIETVDSERIAKEISKRCEGLNKQMDILIEINSAREPQKSGIFPEAALEFVRNIARLRYVKIKGLMTMGPIFGDPEDAREFFKETKRAFEMIKSSSIANTEMKYLSMGMSNSYRVAIEEGANIVRIGTKIFGERRN